LPVFGLGFGKKGCHDVVSVNKGMRSVNVAQKMVFVYQLDTQRIRIMPFLIAWRKKNIKKK
jgi:hypothetical protein